VKATVSLGGNFAPD